MAERIKAHGFIWDWACNVQYTDLSLELLNLTSVVGLFTPGAACDGWRCSLDSTGTFITGVVCTKMAKSNPGHLLNRIDWIKVAPLKVLTFVYKDKMGRIPSSLALSQQGVNVVSLTCGHCNLDVKCTNHILSKCSFINTTRERIFRWCRIGNKVIKSVGDLHKFATTRGRSPKKWKILILICYGLLWLV